MDDHVEEDSWRSWLRTGTRRHPVDPRRARGANPRIKKVLIEGKENGGTEPEPWLGFSSSMHRHELDDALNALPGHQRQIVRLAYFCGLTNRQIAEELGITVGRVRSRLSRSLAAISEHIDRGRNAARRAFYGFAFWLTGRRLEESAGRHGAAADHVLQACVAVAAGAATAVVLAGSSASPAHVTQFDRGSHSLPAVNAEPAGLVEEAKPPAAEAGQAVTTISGAVTRAAQEAAPLVPAVPQLPGVPIPKLPSPPTPKVSLP